MLSRQITGIWRNTEETGERPKYPELKTKYYKIRKDQLIDKLVELLSNKLRWKIIHIDKERGEIMLEKKERIRMSDMVVTVYDLSSHRSAVDVVSSIRGSLGDLGASYQNIVRFYKILDQEFMHLKE